ATYVQDLTRALTRTEPAARYGGLVDLQVDATYATSEYFAAALPQDAAPRFLPEKYVVLLFTESSHAAPLAKEFPELILSLDGRRYLPDMTEEVTTSSHHRMTVVRFPIAPPQGTAHRVMTLTLPSGESMDWHMPLLLPVSVAPSATATEGFKLTPPLILALLGGMLAAMWPCLFQLTVFFIPALGGLTMSDASAGVSLRKRMSVVKAAFFFVLGFTVVYTAAGALIGFAAQRLGTMPDYLVWQRYLGIAGGILIIILALRVAAKVRAPLVCKMPVLSKMAHSQRPASPLEMMFAGLAFATGCMTCFGAAIVVTMVIYVGMAASPSLGALTMLVFSLGMGIPLVIAATAMAKVLPVLFKLEKVIPWMGLGASVLMVGFAILLITGNYMAATEWVFRVLPGAGS
ncbi:MAG: sulfite exporter TauE/SafE family protein, partial [Chloroflexi bacterium]|nr:sulfite exporter TauE/SafE family protein [Chloroflexota bacterium]